MTDKEFETIFTNQGPGGAGISITFSRNKQKEYDNAYNSGYAYWDKEAEEIKMRTNPSNPEHYVDVEEHPMSMPFNLKAGQDGTSLLEEVKNKMYYEDDKAQKPNKLAVIPKEPPTLQESFIDRMNKIKREDEKRLEERYLEFYSLFLSFMKSARAFGMYEDGLIHLGTVGKFKTVFLEFENSCLDIYTYDREFNPKKIDHYIKNRKKAICLYGKGIRSQEAEESEVDDIVVKVIEFIGDKSIEIDDRIKQEEAKLELRMQSANKIDIPEEIRERMKSIEEVLNLR